MQDFNNLSYEKHKNHYETSFDKDRLASWKNKNTIDYWRHHRMYSNLEPLLEADSGASWLTVGDGRYGTDANYIISQGVRDVLATDISDTYLKIAKDEGFINNYAVENTEKLGFDNNTFDYVLCKESYHHFPRPMLALYEMLRVAKKAIVLMEPQDSNILMPSRFKLNTLVKWSKQVIKDFVKLRIGKEVYYDYGNYEEVGNYVFTISEREIEKVALGLNYEMVSFKGLNDCYIDGIEFEEAIESSELYLKVKNQIRKADQKSKKGLQAAGLLIAVIHKKFPGGNLLQKLNDKGFDNRKLPKNPYC